ncbi:MAG: hypothetical protein WA790_00195 [Sulfitobacter sp.]
MAKRKDNWQSQVRCILHEGYGVEDIAVMLEVEADSVREMVKIMRRNGVLDTIYHGRGK